MPQGNGLVSQGVPDRAVQKQTGFSGTVRQQILWFYCAVGLASFATGCGSSSSTPPPPKKLVPKFVYATNYGGPTGQPFTISGFTVDAAGGRLTSMSGSPFASGQNPNSIALHPGGRYLYTANVGSFDLSGYSINATTGALTPISGSPFSAGDNPQAVVVHNSGKFLYVAQGTQTGSTVTGFSIDQSTGVPTPFPGAPVPAGQVISALAQDRSGKFLFASDIQDGKVLGFSIDPATAP
jgi:6-phosphogluconolactonase (cycloisomerase 2 family)